jgi:branched-chain amino acid transport system ATP-binding protein
MFNVLSRVYQPNSGSITFDGVDVLTRPAHAMASLGIARTFQNLAVFQSMTVLENTMVGAHSKGNVGFVKAVFALPAWREDRALSKRCWSILQRLGLEMYAHMPAAGLPFGTLKRIEIARALAAEPRLLLLDEPASGLAHGEVDELGETIRNVRDQFDLTVLLVEHHMAMVMGISDKVVAMEFGRKIVDGTPNEVRNDERVIAAYLGSDA